MADNMMRERGNVPLLKRASAFLAKAFEILKEILQIENDEELETSDSLYLALYWQFMGKLAARQLDSQLC